MDGLLSKQEFLRRVRTMDPYQFEHFVADVWKERGYKTTVRSGSGDRGIDVVATRGVNKQLIQAKRYSQSNKVGSQEVRNYAILYQQVEDVDSVIIVTTSSFTNEARRLATDLDVTPIDATKLFEIVNSYAPGAAVEYLHQDNPRSDNHHVSQTESTEISNLSPFDNEDQFFEIKSEQDLFRKCPECGDSNIWQGGIRKGIVFTLLKCDNCETVWAIDESWPEKSVHHQSWWTLSHERDLERQEKSESCFIATAAYGTPKAQEIDQLRDLRDEILLQNRIGRIFVDLCYRYTPPVADWIAKKEWRQSAVRTVIIEPSLYLARILN